MRKRSLTISTFDRVVLALFLLGLGAAATRAQTSVPATYAVPSSAVDTSKKGFLVRTWKSPGEPNSIAWAEDQLAGLHGANTADTSTFKDNVYGNAYFDEVGTINYWNTGGEGNFPNNATQNTPGLANDGTNDDSYTIEAFALLDLPAGVTTMGVNSDDGFRVNALGSPDPRTKFPVIMAGQFDGGRGAADTTFQVKVDKAGLYPFRLVYEEGGGDSEVEWFTVSADGNKHLINDSTDAAAIKAYRIATSSNPVVNSLVPAADSTGIAPNTTIQFGLIDGTTPIDATSVKLALDGTALAATATKTGGNTTIKFTPASLMAPGSTHNVVATYNAGGSVATVTWSFTVSDYALLTPNLKVTPDTSKPGFIWNVFANQASANNSNARTDNALAGLLRDSDGTPLPNLADPAAKGVASAAASAPSPANALVQFEIPTVINISQNGTDNAGNFTPDDVMPGVPATDSSNAGIAAEILTYLDLPAGVVTMGVNSDDGFRTTAADGALVLGQFDGGRGAADTIFSFVVQEAGVYPIRTTWEQGGGGANIEWFSVQADGSKVLINAPGGIKAYRALLNPTVRSIYPTAAPRQLNLPTSTIRIDLVDGTSKKLDDKSVTLKLDGNSVTPTAVRKGDTLTVTFTPDGLQVPTDRHSAELAFKDTSGGAVTKTWNFTNLKNLVLPAPKITENFDSYPEDTQPTGWTAVNFTAHCDDGRDITSQTSESYENWVLVSTNNAPSIDGGALNVAPGQTFNGKPVDGVTVGFSSGNVLYAESDSRCNTDAKGRGYVGQTQFITSKPFDCSKIQNVVLTYSALYTQNQDSFGGVEYSVDGGKTWLPVVYYLDNPDIVLKGDGSVNAVATFTAPNTDTSSWVINGVKFGAGVHGYGDGVGAAITQDLAPYIAPRINDDQVEGARIEVYRLPQAGGKSDVRLRLAAMGTDSWWFAIDNIAFYDVAPPVTPAGGQPVELGQTVNGFQDDFNGPTRDPNWVAVGPGGDHYIQTNGVLQVATSHGDPNHLVYMGPGGSNNVQEVLARVRAVAFGTGDPARGGIAVAVSTNVTGHLPDWIGMNLQFRDNTTENVPPQGRQFKFLDDARAWGPAGLRTNIPPQTTPGWTNNTWYWMRLKQDGTNGVFGKVWVADATTPEPADWQMTWPKPPAPVHGGFAGITGGSIDGLDQLEVDYILIKSATLPSTTVSFAPQGPASIKPSFHSITTNGKNAVVDWFGGTLQSSANVIGPWADVANKPSPNTTTVTAGTSKFFRVRQ